MTFGQFILEGTGVMLSSPRLLSRSSREYVMHLTFKMLPLLTPVPSKINQRSDKTSSPRLSSPSWLAVQGWIQTSATSFRKLVRNLKERKKIYIFFLLLNLILVIVFCHRFSFFLLRAPILPAFNLFPRVLYPVAEIRSWQIAVVRGFGAQRVY